VGVAQQSQAATLFGETCASPFGVAPMGLEAVTAYRGRPRHRARLCRR
jgi:L-lactate dehydrogenase (cytochrome)